MRTTLDEDCRNDPPPRFLEAIDQFNREEYYECHETLEELWRAERGRIRDLYKGILQIGVAIHHARRSNFKGALRLMSSGVELARPFAPRCLGIDVSDLLNTAGKTKDQLETMPSAQRLSPGLIPKIGRAVEGDGQTPMGLSDRL